jgi:hypothetical protein
MAKTVVDIRSECVPPPWDEKVARLDLPRMAKKLRVLLLSLHILDTFLIPRYSVCSPVDAASVDGVGGSTVLPSQKAACKVSQCCSVL